MPAPIAKLVPRMGARDIQGLPERLVAAASFWGGGRHPFCQTWRFSVLRYGRMDNHPCQLSRRHLLGALASTSACLALGEQALAQSASYVARPPPGMVRLSLPGKVIKVTGTDTLGPTKLWPQPSAARQPETPTPS